MATNVEKDILARPVTQATSERIILSLEKQAKIFRKANWLQFS